MPCQVEAPRALQLVSLHEGGHVQLDENVLRQIFECPEARDRRVVELSVMGAYRRGKSFLLNFFLRYLRARAAQENQQACSSTWMGGPNDCLEGFQWNFGVNRVTTGILVWPEIFVIGDMAVVLMDTQGTFDRESSMKENTSIVAISALVSSVQVFNVHERLESTDLTNLEFFMEYGNLIQACDGHKKEQQDNVKVFQKFLILIRDWNFPNQFAFGFNGGMNYYLDFVNPQEGPRNVDFNSVRHTLHTCFEDVGCCLLPYPGDRVNSSAEFQGLIQDMDGQFVEQVRGLVETLAGDDGLTVKRVGGREVTGAQLLQHVRAYVAAFNSGQLPEPKTMFNILADDVARQLVKEARDLYVGSMRAGEEAALKNNTLENLHEECQRAALHHFDSAHKLGSANHVQTFRCMLVEQIGAEYARFLERAASWQRCSELQAAVEQQAQQNREMQSRLEQLGAENQAKKKQLDEQNRRIDELQGVIQQAEARAQEQQAQMESLARQARELAEKNNAVLKKNQELQEQNTKLQKDMQNLQQKVTALPQTNKPACCS